MKRNRVSGISILAFLLAVCLSASAFGEPVLSPSRNYKDVVTQRQTVDMLLNEAMTVFRSPARASTAGYTGKLPGNMEIVADRLLLAAELEPYRVDLLFGAASAYIANGDLEKALEIYGRILETAPEDIDAHSYLAAWQRFKKNDAEYERHMRSLETLSPFRARHLKDVFSVIDEVSAAHVRDALPQEEVAAFKGPVAIVTLGYALFPDGTMHDILIQRLEKTLELAHAFPEALIVVTGGVPQNNKTEARLMAQWLAENGIDASRIVEDNTARSTVENALFSRYVLARHKIANAIIVSSGSHVRRAQALFTIACRESGPSDIEFVSVAAPDKPLEELREATPGELSGIYRDALKTMGLWSFRSYPLEER